MSAKRVYWSKRNTLTLIRKYKEFPELWNCNMSTYTNETTRAWALKQVSDMLKIHEGEVSRRWRSLACRMGAEIKKMEKKKKTRNGREASSTNVWVYYTPLRYLEIHHVCNSSTDSLPMRKELCHNEALKRFFAEQEEARNAQSAEPENEFKPFGDFVATELKNMHSDSNRLRMKVMIQRIVLKTVEEDLIENNLLPPEARGNTLVQVMSVEELNAYYGKKPTQNEEPAMPTSSMNTSASGNTSASSSPPSNDDDSDFSLD